MSLIISGANVIMGTRLYNVIDGTNKVGGYITAVSYGKNVANYRWIPAEGYRLASAEETRAWSELVLQAERWRETRWESERILFDKLQTAWNARFKDKD